MRKKRSTMMPKLSYAQLVLRLAHLAGFLPQPSAPGLVLLLLGQRARRSLSRRQLGRGLGLHQP